MTVDADQDIKDPEAYWDEITGDQGGSDKDAVADETADDDPEKDAAASLDDQSTAEDEPPSNDDDDPWASAPENLRKLYEQSLAEKDQLISRERGRAAGQQRRAQEIQARLDELSARLNDTTKSQSDDDGDDDARGDEIDPLAALEEDYPDVAGPLVKTIKSQSEKLEKLESHVTSQAARDAKAIEDKFLEKHPDGYQVITDNADAFNEWLYDAPGAIRDAFAENQKALVNAESAAMVISEFKKSLGSEADPNLDTNTDLQSKRERQLRAANPGNPQKNQGGRRPGPPDPDRDPESYWNHLVDEKAS